MDFSPPSTTCPAISDRLTVRRKSRDMTAAFSPLMRQEMKDKFADVVVRPRHKDDVLRIASAAARSRMPLIARGGGTANFGQGIPLRGGAIVDMTALDTVVWIKRAARCARNAASGSRKSTRRRGRTVSNCGCFPQPRRRRRLAAMSGAAIRASAAASTASCAIAATFAPSNS